LDSLTPIALQGTIFPRFEDVFCWLLHWISWIYTPYFYFRCRWPTDLESMPSDAHLASRDDSFRQVWSWYDYPLPSYSVFDTLRDLVTLTFDLLTLVIGHTWRVTWPTTPTSLKMLRLYVLELWVLTSPIGYHWQCVCRHCACAVSRDVCGGGKFFPHIWNRWPRFAYSLYNIYGATIKTNGVIRQNNVYSPVLKITQLSAHAQNDISIERCRKSFTTVVLGGHDFL